MTLDHPVFGKIVTDKTPQEFQIGDVITNTRGTPYSGSPITKVEGIGDGVTQVSFENGEIVEFFNGILHPIEG